VRFMKSLPLLLLLTACASVAPVTSTVPPAAVEPAATSIEVATTPAETATPTILGTALQWTSGSLVFTLESPVDDAIVAEPQTSLVGTTTVETILSVNDAIYILPAGQPFSIPLPLLEGPNALGIVASDYSGDFIEFVLTVIYQP